MGWITQKAIDAEYRRMQEIRRMRATSQRRKKAYQEWMDQHREGITGANLKEFKAFMRKREQELKEVGDGQEMDSE